MQRLAAFLITLWAGSLWTICALVAPILFAVLDDRQLAGRLAATFFFAATVIGVVVGGVLIALNLARKVKLPGRALVLITAGLPLASHLILGPLMDQARAAADMARFGLLHGVAAACFLIACVSALVLVWKFNHPAE